MRGRRDALLNRVSDAQRRRASIALAVGFLALSKLVRADPITSLALEPAPAGDAGMAVERASVKGEGLLSFRFLADISRRPLVVDNRRGDRDDVLDSQIWLHTLATYAMASRFALSLDVPAVLGATEGDHPPTGRAAPGPDVTSAIGDLRMGARLALLGAARRKERGYDLAINASVWLPTGRDAYASDGAVRAGATALAQGEWRQFYWAANVGVRGRPTVRLGFSSPLRNGSGLALNAAAGIYLDAARSVSVGPELVCTTALVDAAAFTRNATVAHLLLAAQYLAADGPLEVGLAAGPDFGRGPGSGDYRVLLHVGMVPERALLRPVDTDGDQITDEVDACARTPGVRSDDPDKNGCPAAADTDSDRIVDKDDACPTAYGDPSPEPMLNGCPPLPSELPLKAELDRERITIEQQVAFVTGSAILLGESDAILRDVARVLEEHPEIELVEVQGHTDERGSVEYNGKLSQDRAASVVTWLVEHGVAPPRLVARGYGRERPIADNTTDLGMQRNRRVEFHVLRTSGQPASEAPR